MYFFIPEANKDGVIASVVEKIKHTIEKMIDRIVKDERVKRRMNAH